MNKTKNSDTAQIEDVTFPGMSAIVAEATPPGKGGISVIRLSGEGAYAVAEQVFRPAAGKSLKQAKGYSALYGHFHLDGQVFDDGLALCFRAPHSYTGEDVVELSCHGGRAVTQGLLSACVQAGARPAQPGEFTRRAVMNGRMSLCQAEAVMDLIEAPTRTGAEVAQAGLSGALFCAIGEMKQQLLGLLAHVAAWCDYPEEDVEALPQQQCLEITGKVYHGLQKLIENHEQGSILLHGVKTAIVGSPNVGKSTLFNLLSGQEHAIVTPIPGTTRDVVRQQVQIAGIPLNLADTAGLHDTQDAVEKEGIRRSYNELEQAAFIIAVFDGSAPAGPDDLALAQRCKGRVALALINKSDLGTQMKVHTLAPYFERVLVVSAHEAETVGKIEEATAGLLNLADIETTTPMLANARQLAAAVQAREALAQALAAIDAGLGLDAVGVCLEDALRALAALTGEDAAAAVIDEVFSRFCVGK